MEGYIDNASHVSVKRYQYNHALHVVYELGSMSGL